MTPAQIADCELLDALDERVSRLRALADLLGSTENGDLETRTVPTVSLMQVDLCHELDEAIEAVRKRLMA